MRRGAWIILLLAACTFEHADSPAVPHPIYTVDGDVHEYPSDAPVPGATVTFLDHSAVTDTSGAFELTQLPAGQDNITASKSGYVTASQILTVGGARSNYTVHMQMARVPPSSAQ